MSFNRSLILKFCMLLCMFTAFAASAQADSSASKKRIFFAGFPLLYYTPETRFAFGASGLCLFSFKKDTANSYRSSLSLSAIYTQNKQALFTLPYNIFGKNKAYWYYGEISFTRFNYNFYGVGNEVPLNFVERYGVSYPRLRFSALKKVWPHVYLGLRYAYDNFKLFNLDPAGILVTNKIVGSKGGVVSGFGGILLVDSRDNLFYPSKGLWSEFVFYRDDIFTGSSFNYNRISFDLVKYLHFNKNIFALNVYSLYSNTDMPFFQMAGLGGLRRMRGFYESRYRDNNAIVLQAEYRRVLWGPLGITVFAAVGQVAERYSKFNLKHIRNTGGLGLRCRIDKSQNVFLRLDVAYGNGKVLPYFTIAEAF